MPRTGAVFALTPSTVAPAVPGTPASAADFNAAMDDISQALSDSMVTDAPAFTSPASFDGGTEDEPGITFTGDLDTGIWHPAANQVAITVDGAVTGTVLLAKPTGVDVTGDLNVSGTILGATVDITRGDLPTVGEQISTPDTGTYSSSAAAFTDVTNATVTITTTGRPVILFLQGAGAGAGARVFMGANSGTPALLEATLRVVRSGSSSDNFDVDLALAGTAYVGLGMHLPPSTIMRLDPVAAGTYTYKLQVSCGTDTIVAVDYCSLVAYEL